MSVWRKEDMDSRAAAQACFIVVIYENLAARDLAIRHCDVLAQRFMDDLEFDISWWRFGYLADPDIAREAGQAAARADLMLVALEGDLLPGHVQTWLERWLAAREGAPGALALMRTSARDDDAVDAYLQLAARNANLEYLSQPHALPSARLDKLREDQISADSTGLSQSPGRYHSSGWGINE